MLALWEFFWDEPTWTGSPAPTPPSPPPPSPPPAPSTPLPPPAEGGAGHGQGHGNNKHNKHEEFPSVNLQDFWDTRETYLRSLMEPAPAPQIDNESEANAAYEERQQQLEQLHSDRSDAITALRFSNDIDEMKERGALITSLNDRISSLTSKQGFARFMRKAKP